MAKKGAARSKYALLEHSTKRTCDISHTVSVGREKTDLVFSTLVSLSRQHFKIIIDGDGAWIEDLGSSNGTLLNQNKLQPNVREPLYNGDSIIAGKVIFTFQVRPSIKKQQTNSQIEIAQPRDLGVPLPPMSADDKLSPEISLVRDRPKKTPGSKVRVADAPISMLAHQPDEGDSSRKRYRYYSGLSQQWTTALLAAILIFMAREEFNAIQTSNSGGPHSVKDVLLRYLFAVGLMYVSMVVIQFFCVLTFARRWYAAVLTVGISVFLGTLIGDELDRFAEFRKAEIENNIQVTKSSKKRIAQGDRRPASEASQ